MSGPEKRLSGEGVIIIDGETVGIVSGVTIWTDEVGDWTDEDWQRAKDAFRAGEYESQFVTCDFNDDRVMIVSGGAGSGKSLRQDSLRLGDMAEALREKLVVEGGPYVESVGIWEKPQVNRRRFKRNARRQRK